MKYLAIEKNQAMILQACLMRRFDDKSIFKMNAIIPEVTVLKMQKECFLHVIFFISVMLLVSSANAAPSDYHDNLALKEARLSKSINELKGKVLKWKKKYRALNKEVNNAENVVLHVDLRRPWIPLVKTIERYELEDVVDQAVTLTWWEKFKRGSWYDLQQFDEWKKRQKTTLMRDYLQNHDRFKRMANAALDKYKRRIVHINEAIRNLEREHARVSRELSGATVSQNLIDNWDGLWQCTGPNSMRLDIGGKCSTKPATNMSAQHFRVKHGPTANEDYFVDKCENTQASGRYLYKDRNPQTGPPLPNADNKVPPGRKGQRGHWPGSWSITMLSTDKLTLIRNDRAGSWKGEYTCERMPRR